MSDYVNIEALRDALSQATCTKLKMRENTHGVNIYTNDGYEMSFAWCGQSSAYSAMGSRARREVGTRADAALIVALVNAAPALLDELAMRRQQVLDMAEDQGALELRAETAEAECARVLKLVREERARALDGAAAACDEAIADEMKTLRSVGYIDASVHLRETFRALAAKERAPATPTPPQP